MSGAKRPFRIWSSCHAGSRHSSANFPFFGRNTGKGPIRVPTRYSTPDCYISNGTIHIAYALNTAVVSRTLANSLRRRLPGVHIQPEGVAEADSLRIHYSSSLSDNGRKLLDVNHLRHDLRRKLLERPEDICQLVLQRLYKRGGLARRPLSSVPGRSVPTGSSGRMGNSDL